MRVAQAFSDYFAEEVVKLAHSQNKKVLKTQISFNTFLKVGTFSKIDNIQGSEVRSKGNYCAEQQWSG